MRILFGTKKHFKTGSCSKLHIHLKTELSHETRLPEFIPTTRHMLCDSLMSVSLSSITNTGQNDFISRSFLWSNMVKCSTASSTGLMWWLFNERGNRSTSHHSGYWSTAPRRILQIPPHKHFFPHWKSCSAQIWLSKSLLKWCHHLIHHLTCAVFMHPNTCYHSRLNGLSAHNCHSHLYTTHY